MLSVSSSFLSFLSPPPGSGGSILPRPLSQTALLPPSSLQGRGVLCRPAARLSILMTRPSPFVHFCRQKRVWVSPPCLLTVVFVSCAGICLVHFKAVVLLRKKGKTFHARSMPVSWALQLTVLSLFLTSSQIPPLRGEAYWRLIHASEV